MSDSRARIQIFQAVAAVIALVFLVVLFTPLITGQRRKDPGTLLVWLVENPEAEISLGIFADQFEDYGGAKVEIEYKDPLDLRHALIEDPSLLDDVDVVEVDLFDLEDAAPAVRDLQPLFTKSFDIGLFYGGPFEAGKFGDKNLFIPWRLSWPALVISQDYFLKYKNLDYLAKVAEHERAQMAIPAADDREFYAFVCSVVFCFGGDPEDPEDPGLLDAMNWLAQISPLVTDESAIIRGGEVHTHYASLPEVFIEWPKGLVPLTFDDTIPGYYRVVPILEGAGNFKGEAFLGSYLAVTAASENEEEAMNFIVAMCSSQVQQDLLFNSNALPVRKDGWGHTGTVRETAYGAFAQAAINLKAPPRDLKKISEGLARAGRRVLFEDKSPKFALAEYAGHISE